MAALLSLSLVAPETLSRPSPVSGVSRPLILSTAYRRFGGGFATRRKSNSVSLRSADLPVVNSADDKPIIVIDNYDSFTYNLCQVSSSCILFLKLTLSLHSFCFVLVDGCAFLALYLYSIPQKHMGGVLPCLYSFRKRPTGLLISPGPGAPKDSGISLQTVLELGPCVPLFGVCMGLQCIGEAFGGKIVRSPYGVVHGKSAKIYYDEKLEDMLFSGLAKLVFSSFIFPFIALSLELSFDINCLEILFPFTAARYHSLVIDNDSFPDDLLEITAWTEDGLIMAARHKKYKHIQDFVIHVGILSLIVEFILHPWHPKVRPQSAPATSVVGLTPMLTWLALIGAAELRDPDAIIPPNCVMLYSAMMLSPLLSFCVWITLLFPCAKCQILICFALRATHIRISISD
ncbi:Anthranilate synthase component II [Apostasia shenzhenica]|uniref:anthranilate synthase n=1 Tax=Apostasia shenzhenica TaxID=1088818 RepID=A0A2I0AKP5_9ASPA|nr:Anthranilate synthase component II [Apostasia shenzhenica]